MKGFEIKIQKSLSEEQRKIAEEVAFDFIKRTIEHKMSYAKAYRTRSGTSSYLKRNVLGYTWGGLKEAGLTLRRISKNRRSFGIVKLEDLYIPELKIRGHELKECMCPKYHGGGRRVVMNIHVDDFVLFAKIGKVKG